MKDQLSAISSSGLSAQLSGIAHRNDIEIHHRITQQQIAHHTADDIDRHIQPVGRVRNLTDKLQLFRAHHFFHFSGKVGSRRFDENRKLLQDRLPGVRENFARVSGLHILDGDQPGRGTGMSAPVHRAHHGAEINVVGG